MSRKKDYEPGDYVIVHRKDGRVMCAGRITSVRDTAYGVKLGPNVYRVFNARRLTEHPLNDLWTSKRRKKANA